MNEETKIARRKVIAGLGVGLASMAVKPVFADQKKFNGCISITKS